jgi:futalosine hydrolase
LRDFVPSDGVELLAGGIGPVEAGIATARVLTRGTYDAVINAGIGGAFRGSAHVGEAVLVRDERFADFGLEGGGAPALPDGARLVDEAIASPELLERCAALPFRTVRGLTVTSVTTTRATADRLQKTYGAGVESMEGFAVLRAAELAGVPALEVRGISNYVDDRARSEWDFAAGSRAACRALEAVLESLAKR